MTEENETCSETSAGGWCGQSATIVFGGWRTRPLHGNGGRPKADRANRGSAERGVHWWCVRSVPESAMIRWAGEHVDVYANKIRQLVGLTEFKEYGLERLTKLTFVTGFPDAVSIGLQRAPNIEALTLGDLISRARVLTETEEQNQDVVAAMRSPHGSARSSPSTNVTCYRCNIKGHLPKDCRKREMRCYRCGKRGHWAWNCSGNEQGENA